LDLCCLVPHILVLGQLFISSLLFASYAALGLVHTLNPLASGGAEHDPIKASVSQTILASEPSRSDASQVGPFASTSSIAPIPKGYGKIIRDFEGNVVRIELSEDQEERVEHRAEEDETLGLRDPEVEKQVITTWVTELGGGKGSGAAIVQCESASILHLSFFWCAPHCCCSHFFEVDTTAGLVPATPGVFFVYSKSRHSALLCGKPRVVDGHISVRRRLIDHLASSMNFTCFPQSS
jgi:hypothetical protein